MIEQLLLDSCWGNWWDCYVTELMAFAIPSYLLGMGTISLLVMINKWWKK